MNTLVKFGLGAFAAVIFLSMVNQCGSRNDRRSAERVENVPTEIILKEYSKGLDLKAVTELAKKCKDAPEFEKRLNEKSEAVNNIDLNDDGKVDYIKVTEYGSGDTRGFSLTTEIKPGEVQEIATIEFEKNAEKATVQTTGNPSLYGANNYQHSSFGLTDALLVGWLFSNRGGSYQSPYGYGNYPRSYGGGWGKQGNQDYAGSMTSRTAGSTLAPSSQSVLTKSTPSPNAEKVAARARAISNPTRSQKSFGGGTNSPGTAGNGSTTRPSSHAPSRPSTARPSSSRSGGFGGFGRSSSSGSSRSGSSRGGGK